MSRFHCISSECKIRVTPQCEFISIFHSVVLSIHADWKILEVLIVSNFEKHCSSHYTSLPEMTLFYLSLFCTFYCFFFLHPPFSSCIIFKFMHECRNFITKMFRKQHKSNMIKHHFGPYSNMLNEYSKKLPSAISISFILQ